MYKQFINASGELSTNMILRTADNAYIPFDPDNTDFVEYQKWLDAGNVPLPADEPNA